jgi:predicted metal-dependent hydrolase
MRKNTKKRRTNTKKRWWGGDITKQDAFEKILSIGYEFETSSLANLQGIVEGGKLVAFLNRDTARTDVGEEQYDVIEVPALNENNEEVDKKEMSFLITNDISQSSFVKKLIKLCETDLITVKKNQVKKAIKYANLYKYKEQIMEALESGRYGDVFGNLDALFEKGTIPKAKKNTLYEKLEDIYKQNDNIYKYIRTDQYDEAIHSKKYDIRFKFSSSANSIISCGTFSDVEWIATYYKPKKSKNVVLDTFINAIRNLCRHLDQYTGKIQGYLEMTTGTRERDIQTKIENPLTRTTWRTFGPALLYANTFNKT